MKKTNKEKIKSTFKYICNGLNMINALLLALSPIWGWHTDKITSTIIAVTGVLSLYFVTGKMFETKGDK